MDACELALEAQIDALRQQQMALESQLGLPAGQTHHNFHEAAANMIRQEQARDAAQRGAGARSTPEGAEDCQTCCPRGCCPQCCLCPSCRGGVVLAQPRSACECGCTDCARGDGGCRRGGYTRYYYNAESQRGRDGDRTAQNQARSASASVFSTSRPARTRGQRHGVTTLTSTTAQAAPTQADVPAEDTGLSLSERLAQIEAMRRKYSRAASRAMRDYQHAVSNHEGYEAERQRRLRTARPFSFEDRELTRPVRIREARMESERRQREGELQSMLHQQFKARAVPPTTFMNKYDVMVEEWCQRKLAVEMLAREKADQAKEEAAYVRFSAENLRRAREETMGVRYDKNGKQITRSAARMRAESADAAKRRREAMKPNKVPLEVQLTLWPALREHEQVRKERLLHQARQAREETNTFFHQTMPLLANPSQVRVFGDAQTTLALAQQGHTNTTTTVTTTTTTYGIGQPVATQAEVTQTSTGTAACSPPGGAVPMPTSTANAAVPPPPPPPPLPTGPNAVPAATPAMPVPMSSVPPPPPVPPTAAVPVPPAPVPAPLPPGAPPTVPTAGMPPPPPPPPVPSAPAQAPPAGAPPPSAIASSALASTTNVNTAAPTPVTVKENPTDPLDVQRRYNPNLTFKPALKPGVPNFERLWAEEQVALLARKKRRPPTKAAPFHLTPSAKENVVGKKRVVSRSVPAPRQNRASASPHQTNPAGGAVSNATTTKDGAAPPTSSKLASDKTPAKGTRAHALRTQAVYRQYVDRAGDSANQRFSRAETQNSTTAAIVAPSDPAVEAYWRGVAERRKEVRERLNAYLPVDPKIEHEEAIRSKVRALRAAAKDSEMSAKEKLEEMRTRVAQMPPVFAEPTHLNDLSKARADAEREILQMLKDTGLQAHTIREVLVRKPTATAAEAEKGNEAEPSPSPQGNTEEAKKDRTSGSDKYSDSDFDSSSSSGDDDSSASSSVSAAATGANKKPNDYGDDEFESSGSDSSDSSV